MPKREPFNPFFRVGVFGLVFGGLLLLIVHEERMTSDTGLDQLTAVSNSDPWMAGEVEISFPERVADEFVHESPDPAFNDQFMDIDLDTVQPDSAQIVPAVFTSIADYQQCDESMAYLDQLASGTAWTMVDHRTGNTLYGGLTSGGGTSQGQHYRVTSSVGGPISGLSQSDGYRLISSYPLAVPADLSAPIPWEPVDEFDPSKP